MSGIRIEIQLEDGSFTSGLLRAGQSLKSFKSELSRLDPHFRTLNESGRGGFRSFNRLDVETKSLTSRLRDLTIVAGGAAIALRQLGGAGNGIIGSIVGVNAEMERLRFQLAGMSTAMDPMRDAADQVNNLLAVAKSAPFSLSAITSTMVKMKVAGLDPMNGSMESLLDGVAAFGGTDDVLHRITLGITQMSGKGVIQMEELRQQLGESMPAAMKTMSRSMGMSIGEFVRLVGTGRVEAKSALAKWFEEVDRSYGGASDRMMKTFSGQVSRLKTALTEQVIREGGGTNNAYLALSEMVGKVVKIAESEDATRFFDMMGEAAQAALVFIEKLAAYLVRVKDFVKEFGTAFTYAIGGIVMGAAVTRGIRMISTMVVAMVSLQTNIKMVTEGFKSMRKAAIYAEMAKVGAATGPILAAGVARHGDLATAARRDGAVRAAAAAQEAAIQRAIAREAQSGVARAAGGLMTAGRGLFAVFSRVLGMLGPIALGVSILGPLIWDIGKGIYSWFTGAKDAKAEIEEVQKTLQRVALENNQAEIKVVDDTAAKDRDRLDVLWKPEQDRLEAQWQRAYDALKRYEDRGKQAPQSIVDGFDRANRDLLAGHQRYQDRVDEIDANAAARRAELIEQQPALLAAALAEEARLRRQAVESERDNLVSGAEARMYEDTQAQQAEYNRVHDELAKKRDEMIEEEKAAGRSGNRAVEWYKKEVGEAQAVLYEARAEAMKTIWEELDAIQEKSEGVVMAMQEIDEERRALIAKAEESRNQLWKVELLDAPESDEKKIERLMRYINSARDKVKELSAELRGSSGALAKLLFQIERGDFGSLNEGTVEAERFRNELIQTTVAAEMLQGIFDGFAKANRDLDSIMERNTEEYYKALAINQGIDPDDELAYLRFKFENGLLDIGKDVEDLIDRQFRKVTEGVDLALPQFQSLASTMQDTAFGNQTLEAIQRVREAIEGLGGAAAAIQFPDMRSPFAFADGTGSGLGVPMGGEAFVEGLMRRGVSRHAAIGLSWNAYDESRFNPGAIEATPNVHGTRGIGMMQWTGPRAEKLRSFAQGLGTTWEDKEAQLDFLVWELMNTHSNAGRAILGAGSAAEAAISALKGYLIPAKKHQQERELKYRGIGSMAQVLPERLQSGAINPQIDVRDAAEVGFDQFGGRLSDAEAERASQQAEIERAKVTEAIREMEAKLEAARAGDDSPGTNNQHQARIRILTGKFGSVTDLKDERYTRLLKLAEELDELGEKTRDRNQAMSEIERNAAKLDEQRLEIAQRRADAEALLKDPNYKGMSRDLMKLNALEAEHLKLIERVAGKDSQAYRDAQAEFARQRAEIMSLEGTQALIEADEMARAAQREAMTDRERRRAEYLEKLAELTSWKDAAIAAGMEVSQAMEIFERGRAALAKKFAQDSRTAMAQQVEQMGRLDESLRQAAAGWPSALSNALYEQDMSGFGDAVRESIARALTDKAASLFLKPLMGAIEGPDGEGGLIGFANIFVTKIQDAIKKANMGGAAGGGGFFSSILSFIGSLFGFGTAHTGAIVGAGFAGSAQTSLASFIGAPRFHTGGIVGSPGRKHLNLRSDEVPIIAQKGEGIFTSEQMKHLGGNIVRSSNVTITGGPITVNGGGGSPEQNSDLARQIAAETEKSMRGLVRAELVNQLKPGGMLR